METDKVIETTINRNSKTPGGQTGETDFNEPSLVCLNNLHRVSIAKRLFWPYFFLMVLLFYYHLQLLELQLLQFKGFPLRNLP